VSFFGALSRNTRSGDVDEDRRLQEDPTFKISIFVSCAGERFSSAPTEWPLLIAFFFIFGTKSEGEEREEREEKWGGGYRRVKGARCRINFC
jgi:hypothetical protein